MNTSGSLKDGQDRIAVAIVLFILTTNVLLAKFAIPGSDGSLSIRLVSLYAALSVGVLSGRLLINPQTFVFFSGVALSLVLVSFAPLTTKFSYTSLMLILFLILPYVFCFRAAAIRHRTAFAIYNGIAIVLSLCALVQFPAQFVIGPETAFWLDYNIPESIAMKGFNNLNDFNDGSDIIKSNGVFLLEASGLSQFVCLAIIIELTYFRRAWAIVLYCAAMVVSYSGTGILMLLMTAPILLWREGGRAIAALAVAVLVGFLFFDELKLGLFLERMTEFESTGSSGYARFLSIFRLLTDYVWHDSVTTFIGRGPGSVTENNLNLDYAAHDPSWGKIMYEYGVLGFMSYFSFFFYCVWRARVDVAVKLAMTFQFLFLGGLVGSPEAHSQILALVIWPHDSPSRDVRDGAPPLRRVQNTGLREAG